MKCPECDGVGRIHYGEEWCSACNGTGEVEMTEQEYIKTFDTEQLAEWLQEHMDCASCSCKTLCHQGHDCKLALMEWLKQPHTKE